MTDITPTGTLAAERSYIARRASSRHTIPKGSGDQARRYGIDADRREFECQWADDRSQGSVHRGESGGALDRTPPSGARDQCYRSGTANLTYAHADGVEIRPKLVVEAGSHLYLIEVLERANRAAATESDDQVVELPTRAKKACSFTASRASTARPVPRSPIAAAAAVTLSAVRPVTQTCAPARHNSIAAAKPMPEVPPTITAFCSSAYRSPCSWNHRAGTRPRSTTMAQPDKITSSRVFRGW